MKTKVTNKIMIFIFCAFIAVTGILYVVLPKSDYSSKEKRYLAAFPTISISSIKDGSFSEDFESFLSDHTPFRTFFVSLNAYFELYKGNNGSNGVYKGSDGWLIEKPFDRDNKYETNLSRIKVFADEVNVPVCIMAVPSKGYVYSQYLPDNAMQYEDEKYLETLNEMLKDSAEIIDISKSFIENRDKEQLFYRTDHHWTSAGAFLAYKAFCNAKGFKNPDISDYNIEITDGFYGTSYSTSCYTLTKPDTVEFYRSKSNNGKADVTITEGSKVSEYDNMFFENHAEDDDKYPIFLDGNHSMVTIKTRNEGGRLLLIKDSFAHCLAPFLAENYSEIVMIDLRYYKDNVKELIENEGITDILFVYSIENLATSKDIIFD